MYSVVSTDSRQLCQHDSPNRLGSLRRLEVAGPNHGRADFFHHGPEIPAAAATRPPLAPARHPPAAASACCEMEGGEGGEGGETTRIARGCEGFWKRRRRLQVEARTACPRDLPRSTATPAGPWRRHRRASSAWRQPGDRKAKAVALAAKAVVHARHRALSLATNAVVHARQRQCLRPADRGGQPRVRGREEVEGLRRVRADVEEAAVGLAALRVLAAVRDHRPDLPREGVRDQISGTKQMVTLSTLPACRLFSYISFL